MRDDVQRTAHSGIHGWRSGLLVLAGLAILASAGTAAALAGNGGGKTPPGQAKKTETAPAQPTHAAHPARPAHPAKPAHPAHPARPAQPGKAGKPSSPGKSADAQHHVIICHRTGSSSHPYVVIDISIRAWEHGHQTHPAIDGRNDILLQDPASPGEKLPVSRCTTAAPASPATTTTTRSPSSPTTTTTDTHPSPTGTVPVPTHTAQPPEITVVDSTKPGVENTPQTTAVDKPLVIVVHTTPNTTVTVHGAGASSTSGVLGAAKTVSNKRGVARLEVVPTKRGLLAVKVGHRTVKRFGVLGAHTSGASLTG